MTFRFELRETTLDLLLKICSTLFALLGLKMEQPPVNMSWKNRLKYCFMMALLLNWFYIAPSYHIMLGLESNLTGVYGVVATGALVINKMLWLYISRNRISALCAHARVVESAIDGPARDLKRAALTNLVFFINVVFNSTMFISHSFFGDERRLPESYSTIPGLHPALETPNYEISLIIYVMSVLGVAILCAGYRMLFALLVELCAARIRLIGIDLEQLGSPKSASLHDSTNSTSDLPLETKLNKLINRHVDVIVLVNMMQTTYDSVVGIDFGLIFISIITVLMKLDAGDIMFAVRYTTFLLAEIFLYCYCGQRLIDANEDLQRSIYACGWEEWANNRKTRRAVLMIQRAAQRSLSLNAAKQFPLNRDTFMRVMQGCYTFIAALSAKN